MKKKVLSTITAICLTTSSTQAGGIPVMDVASIAQSVMQYTQMIKDFSEQIKQYEQMLKDGLNMEKQLKNLGVDMTDIRSILGNVQGMVNDMQNIYNEIRAIPDNVMGEADKIQKACSYLQQESKFFGMTMQKTKLNILGTINRCTTAISDQEILTQALDEISSKMTKTTDRIKQEEYKVQMQNMKNAAQFLKEKQNLQNINKLMAFKDMYENSDQSSPYSKEKMTNDLKELSKQVNKSNNQKQAQALTNALLLKILENMQRQYELNIAYTTTTANSAIQGSQSMGGIKEEDFNTKVVVYKRNDEIFKPERRTLPRDELGLPKFILD